MCSIVPFTSSKAAAASPLSTDFGIACLALRGLTTHQRPSWCSAAAASAAITADSILAPKKQKTRNIPDDCENQTTFLGIKNFYVFFSTFMEVAWMEYYDSFVKCPIKFQCAIPKIDRYAHIIWFLSRIY